MNKSIIKKVLISIAAVLLIAKSLICNPFNIAGLIISLLSIIGMLLILFINRSGSTPDDVTGKSDFLLFFTVLGVSGGQFGSMMKSYDSMALTDLISSRIGYLILLIVVIIGVVILGKKFIKNKLFKRLLSISIIIFTMAYATSSALNSYDYLVLGFVVFYFIFTSALDDIGYNDPPLGRSFWLTVVTAFIIVLRRCVFPSFVYSKNSMIASLNFEVLPFYVVGGIIIIAGVIIGIEYMENTSHYVTSDMLFCAGMASLAIVAKCSVYFHFYYSWLAILFIEFILVGIAIRYAKRTPKKVSFNNIFEDRLSNPVVLMVLLALFIGYLTVQICHGHVYFAITAVFVYFIVKYIPNIFKGWRRDFAKSFVWVLSISLLACARVLTIGYSLNKMMFIIAVAIFTATSLYFLDHNNHIGHNDFKNAKVLMIVIFALILISPVYKAGAHVKVESRSRHNEMVDYFAEPSTEITVNVSADDKHNDIEAVSYVWSNDYTYSKSRIVDVDDESFTLNVEGRHLIVFVTDSNNMTIRRDFWFELY